MKYKENILKGLSAQLIADVAGVSKASVYNWCDGRGRLVGPLITAAIESLIKDKTDDGNLCVNASYGRTKAAGNLSCFRGGLIEVSQSKRFYFLT